MAKAVEKAKERRKDRGSHLVVHINSQTQAKTIDNMLLVHIFWLWVIIDSR